MNVKFFIKIFAIIQKQYLFTLAYYIFHYIIVISKT